jgi:hypothetical protein
MQEIIDIFVSGPFVVVAGIIFSVFYYFNVRVGPLLWNLQNRNLRKFLKFMEMTKLLYPPLMGFGLGFISLIPRPEPLKSSSVFVVACVYFVAGLFCQWIVKGVKKGLQAKGIDIDIDDTPKQQMQ